MIEAQRPRQLNPPLQSARVEFVNPQGKRPIAQEVDLSISPVDHHPRNPKQRRIETISKSKVSPLKDNMMAAPTAKLSYSGIGQAASKQGKTVHSKVETLVK